MDETLLDQLIAYRSDLEKELDKQSHIDAVDEYISLAVAKRIPIHATRFDHVLEYRCILDKKGGDSCTIQMLDSYIRRNLMDRCDIIVFPPRIGTIHIHTLPKNGHISLQVDINNDTIGYVKFRLQHLIGVPAQSQKLIHRGRVMSFGNYTLNQYQLDGGANIYMIISKDLFDFGPLRNPQSYYTGYKEPKEGREGDVVISSGEHVSEPVSEPASEPTDMDSVD